MCSRFENKETGFSIIEKLEKDFLGNFILEDDEELKKDNIAPTNLVMAITKDKEDYKIRNFLWGFQFDKEKKSPLIFNSRIETIKEKKYWTNIFYKNRCLMPATAFYEWKEINKTKIPHKISLPGSDFFFIPSIYLNLDDFTYVSMITATPNSFMKKIHNRMPVILNKKEGLDFLKEEPKKAIEKCVSLSDKVNMEVVIADNLLTQKQKEVLSK